MMAAHLLRAGFAPTPEPHQFMYNRQVEPSYHPAVSCYLDLFKAYDAKFVGNIRTSAFGRFCGLQITLCPLYWDFRDLRSTERTAFCKHWVPRFVASVRLERHWSSLLSWTSPSWYFGKTNVAVLKVNFHLLKNGMSHSQLSFDDDFERLSRTMTRCVSVNYDPTSSEVVDTALFGAIINSFHNSFFEQGSVITFIRIMWMTCIVLCLVILFAELVLSCVMPTAHWLSSYLVQEQTPGNELLVCSGPDGQCITDPIQSDLFQRLVTLLALFTRLFTVMVVLYLCRLQMSVY
jgi:hypothetical protein